MAGNIAASHLGEPHRKGGGVPHKASISLLSILPLLLFTSLAQAVGGADINISTQNLTIPLSGNLNTSNSIYILTAPRSLTSPLNITAANATLDCNNFPITGLSLSPYAIYSYGNRTTIRNCNVRWAQGGIWATGSNVRIENTKIDANTTIMLNWADSPILNNLNLDPAICLQINGTDNGLFENITCLGATSIGIYVQNASNNNTFRNFTISAIESSGGVRAVQVDPGSENNTFDCRGRDINMTKTISEPDTFQPAFISSARGTIIKNCIISNFTRAADITGSQNTFQNNTFSNIAGFGDTHGGLLCSNTNLLQVVGNRFDLTVGATTGYGVYFDSCTGSQIANNTILAAGNNGVFEGFGSENNITGNNISSSGLVGIWSDTSSRTRIIGNNITTATDTCIYALSGDTLRIENNTITETGTAGTGQGIYLDTVSTSTIWGNNITSNNAPACFLTNFGSDVAINNTKCVSTNSTALLLDNVYNTIVDSSNLTGSGFNEAAAYLTFTSGTQILKTSILATRDIAMDLVFADTTTTSFSNITGNRTAIRARDGSSSNTFYLNLINSSGAYANTTGSSGNQFNATYNGKNQGNAWANVLNGSVAITGVNLSDRSPFYIGNGGTGFPYNNSTSLGKIVGSSADFAPLTLIPLVCTVNISYSQAMSPDGLIFHRATSPTWFLQSYNLTLASLSCAVNVTANIYAANGSLVSTITTSNAAASALNNTGVPTDLTIFTNVTANTGTANATTETRQYYIINIDDGAGIETQFQAGMFLILGVLIVYIGTRRVN